MTSTYYSIEMIIYGFFFVLVSSGFFGSLGFRYNSIKLSKTL